jgi:hypothetical protein
MLTIKYFKNGAKPEEYKGVGNCERCREYTKLDVHHRVKRRNDNGNKYTVKLCRKCHMWVEAHEEEAKKENLHIPFYETEEYKKQYGK